MSRSGSLFLDERPALELAFQGEVVFWRGPSPHHFIGIPEAECAEIAAVAPIVSYGWGVIPVAAAIGDTTWTTSLFPRHGGYLLPVRDRVRQAEGIELGDVVDVRLAIAIEEWHPPDR